MMGMDIANSVILITAAGSPMGKAISMHFASLGAQLALLDTNPSTLKKTYEACLAIGGSCEQFLLISKDETTIMHAINNVHNHFGAIDILVNYWLGEDLPSLFSDGAVDKFCSSMTKGATTFFIFGKQAANYMRKNNRKGLIINLAAHQFNSQTTTASGSKAMISGLTQSWALELAEFNIRVGGVVPMCFSHEASSPQSNLLNQHLQYEIVRSAEYIVANDYFNGRMIEAEVG
jgi:NAD(P)-dependent dehydrogenase (short-subunit alcohol dehydrogenase family)